MKCLMVVQRLCTALMMGLVFRVVSNPDNLIGVQAGIQCVQDAPGAADTEVQLQMAITIPGQRGNTIAEGQIQLVQSICHLARALG